MKKIIRTISLMVLLTFSLTLQAETNYYKLKTCSGIDAQGNTFEGAMCEDLVQDGPCDKESICYASDEITPT